MNRIEIFAFKMNVEASKIPVLPEHFCLVLISVLRACMGLGISVLPAGSNS